MIRTSETVHREQELQAEIARLRQRLAAASDEQTVNDLLDQLAPLLVEQAAGGNVNYWQKRSAFQRHNQVVAGW